MSTNVEKPQASSARAGGDVVDEFAGCIPKETPSAKKMSSKERDAAWNKLYSAANASSADEKGKRSIRCAVYVYLAKNGTSPSGTYPGQVQAGNGTTFLASAIPAAAGKLEVRQFARACAVEALRFFHGTEVLKSDPDMQAKCEADGVRLVDVVALVDYLDVVIGLTPSERDTQLGLKNFSIERARRARGGRNLDEVRDDMNRSTLEATGPNTVMAPAANGGW